VLVDCGVSARQVLTRLDAVGLADAPIDAVLVTHEHSDHVAGARVLCKRLTQRTGRPSPFFMSPGTRSALNPKVVPDAVEILQPGQPFMVGHLEVDPFPVPHDSADPVCYRIRSGDVWAGVVTDMGRGTTLVEHKLKSMTIAVLEFNHDIEMLLEGAYPWPLKQRIRSSHGHLSNEQAGSLLKSALPGSQIRHVVLAHLSEKNNAPERAMRQAQCAVNTHGAVNTISLTVAKQRSPLNPLMVPVSDW